MDAPAVSEESASELVCKTSVKTSIRRSVVVRSSPRKRSSSSFALAVSLLMRLMNISTIWSRVEICAW